MYGPTSGFQGPTSKNPNGRPRVRRASSTEDDDDVYKIHAKVIQNFQITYIYIPKYYIIVTPLARWVSSGNSIRRLGGVRAGLIIYILSHTNSYRRYTSTSSDGVDLHNLILYYVPLRIYNIIIQAYCYCC